VKQILPFTVVENSLFEGVSGQKFINSIIAGGSVEIYLTPGTIRLPLCAPLIAIALSANLPLHIL